MINLIGITFLILLAACNNGESDSDAYGNFEATDKLISSEVSGRVMQLKVDEGQELNVGDVIALVDTTQLIIKRKQLNASRIASQSKIEQVKASIDVLNAQKGVLMKDVTRVYNMYREKAATSKQVDDLQGQVQVMDKQLIGYQTQIASVKAELEVIDAQIAEVEDLLSRCTITMPSEGTVLQKFVEQGEMVMIGKPVVKVADLNEMYLRAFVTGSQLPNIKIGQKVEVRFDKTEDSNQVMEGTISWISSSAEFTPKIVQTKEERVDLVYAIKIAVQNDGRVKIGMPGEVKF
ncbi:HlyD family efflux transporter periplasmic adaptor subunit [Carboxylicivirga linearis]|uniref:HlyD family efflux transporter periplasmic adaptor subunit n=2 Tax=Carboxylicivirga linearis TaxID=1628157 RepID=A0ABS5K001_9BACT|nr:HlyD family efflux transporter periplasmic adaptor subunit [Carboxylicivirga linearis]